MVLRQFLLLVTLAAACVWAPLRAQPAGESPAPRHALVIGVDSYRAIRPLRNARSDARSVAQALHEAGFTVMLRLDVDEKAMKEALRGFRASVPAGADVVVYYSGHAIQVGGTNFLLPADVPNGTEEQVRDDAIPLQRILDDLRDRRARFTLAIIDACRDNPFSATARSGSGAGLAATTAASGQMIMFAAGAGQTALDRLGPSDPAPNGVFTRVLLKEIARPAVSADRMLRNVRSEVVALARSVGHEQVPAIYDQSLGDFYFHPGARAAGATGGPPAAGTAPAPGPRRVDHAQGPIARFSDGTTWVKLPDGDVMFVTCLQGSAYVGGRCEGEARLLTLDEAMRAAEDANRAGFAGYRNWIVPNEMFIGGMLYRAGQQLGLSRDDEVADRVFVGGRRALLAWVLPRGQWNAQGELHLGGGVTYRRDGRYPLRLVRFPQ